MGRCYREDDSTLASELAILENIFDPVLTKPYFNLVALLSPQRGCGANSLRLTIINRAGAVKTLSCEKLKR